MESGRVLQINSMMMDSITMDSRIPYGFDEHQNYNENKNDSRNRDFYCNLCPRNCGVNRTDHTGFCQMGSSVKIARAALHFMEEPCISGTKGSGTVFFTGCNLRCVYCQNYKLSHENFGMEITEQRLGEIFLELQEQGAHNINLVTGVMYVPGIIKALDLVRHKLMIPVVYNTSGYEKVETLRQLQDYVDIYLADIKYYSSQLSQNYSLAPDYFPAAMKAVEEMICQKGTPVFFDGKNFDTPDAVLKSGVIIRHMVLPGGREDSVKILEQLAESFRKEDYILSLMSQFTPHFRCKEIKELNRRVTTFEYESVVKEALRLGLDQTYIQERSSAKEEYTPEFLLQGV